MSSIKCLVVLSFLAAGTLLSSATPPATADGIPAFELGGDKLGETIAEFLSLHPKAQCLNATEKMKNCYQWDGVSIFGLAAHPDAGCSLEKRSQPGCAQGLAATFKDNRLTQVTYAVEGSDKRETVAKLKEKYGRYPLLDTSDGTIWMNSGAELSVVVGKATEDKSGPTLITFMIFQG